MQTLKAEIPGPTQRIFLEKSMRAFEFISWDRFVYIKTAEIIFAFGWIERQDLYKDFVLFEFQFKREPFKCFMVASSSKKYSEYIVKKLGGEKHTPCQRIENILFNLKNCIRKKEKKE